MTDLIDALFKSVNCKGILITDGKGIVTQVEETFGDAYGTSGSELVGQSVYDLEREGVFTPSSVVMVLESKREVTIVQRVKNGQDVIVTAFPVFNREGDIEKVVTFTRDITEYTRFKKLYDELVEKMDLYNRNLEEMAYENATIEDFQTRNRDFAQILKNIKRAAKYDVTILITGETGVGKTMLAKRIHKLSENRDGKFVEINCGAMPDSLIESELFGYEGGAFTGAEREGKTGLIEAAGNGTLFLDEISELPSSSQVKLLKVLQDKEIRKIGGTKTIQTNCRFIAASNKDLQEAVNSGKFRQDLFYRLNMVTVNIPPLRDRYEDILYLSKTILKKLNDKYAFNMIFDQEVINSFLKYNWPGNTRELENVIHRMVIMADGKTLTREFLPENILIGTLKKEKKAAGKETLYNYGEISDLNEAIERYERNIIRSCYQRYGSSIKVAKALHISQATAARKIRKYC